MKLLSFTFILALSLFMGNTSLYHCVTGGVFLGSNEIVCIFLLGKGLFSNLDLLESKTPSLPRILTDITFLNCNDEVLHLNKQNKRE